MLNHLVERDTMRRYMKALFTSSSAVKVCAVKNLINLPQINSISDDH